MNRSKIGIGLSLLLVMPLGLSAQAPWGEDALTYGTDFPSRPIGQYLELLEDPTAQLGITDVTSKAFMPSGAAVPNLGVGLAAHWAKFALVNTDPSGNSIALFVDYPEIEELDVYLSMPDGIRHVLSSGQSRPLGHPGQPSTGYSCKLDIPFSGYGTVYLRIKSDKQLQLPLFVIPATEQQAFEINRGIFIGGYSGIMLVMLLYNLFVFISIRDKAYLFYVMYILSVGLTQLSFIGWLGYYFFPDSTWIKEHSSLLLTVTTAVLAMVFMGTFIRAKRHVKYFVPVSYSLMACMVAGVILDVVGYRILAYKLVQGFSVVTSTYMLYVSIKCVLRGDRASRFFLASWCIFLGGITVFVAKDWGLVPYNDLTKYMMAIGSSLDVVLLSFGLADKINVLRKEKEFSHAQALELARNNEQIIRDQNLVLEQKVTERTQALQASNDHLKRTQTQLVSAEKMASLGQLTAGIAHEINNPLNFISSSLQPLKRDLIDLSEVLAAYRKTASGNSDFAEVHALEKALDLETTIHEVGDILAAMENGTRRTSEIVRGLRTFSRLDEDDLKEADVNENIRSTVVVLGPQFRDAVEVQFDLGEIPPAECFPGKLNQLFMNLLNNAAFAVKRRHGNSGGVVRIATRMGQDDVVVEISDNGIGMDEAVQSRLFEPFFTTKDVGEGTGLGLSIAQGIIEKHHGRIALQSQVGQGSRFIISFPVRQPRNMAKRA